MILVADLVVPPNTPDYQPVSKVINPSVGILNEVEIYFRDGCLDAVGVRILEGDRQFAPFPAGWIHDNNNHIYWNEYRHLEGAPYVLVIQGYSIALDWEHTITFKFFMEQG